VVIRPLALVRESELERFAREMAFPIIPCDLCGSQDHLQRKQVKAMLAAWELESPGRTDVMFAALQNVAPSQLADPRLFDFAALRSRAMGSPTEGSRTEVSPTEGSRTEGSRTEGSRTEAPFPFSLPGMGSIEV
jgi:tRNA(Ile)-lysidine synthase TilS/MesJ